MGLRLMLRALMHFMLMRNYSTPSEPELRRCTMLRNVPCRRGRLFMLMLDICLMS